MCTTKPILDASPTTTPETGRVQLALNVDSLDDAIAFYTALLGTPPAKVRPGYANFAVTSPPLKLVLLENPGKTGTLNHLGVEVPSTEKVHSEIARLTGAGLLQTLIDAGQAPEQGGVCCGTASEDAAPACC